MATASTCGLPTCSRPCYERGGIVHGYCGRTHAAEAVSSGILRKLLPPHGNCHRCELHGCVRTVFHDESTGRVHDFCSLSHAQQAMERNEWPSRDSTGDAICSFSGCRKQVYRDPHSKNESKFCSRGHLDAARTRSGVVGSRLLDSSCRRDGCPNQQWIEVKSGVDQLFCSSSCAVIAGHRSRVRDEQCSLPGCVNPSLHDRITEGSLGYCSENHAARAAARSLARTTERHVDRTFSGGTTGSTDFKLSVLTNSHPDYQSLKDQFLSKWVKPETIGRVTVMRIFKVKVPADVLNSFKRYERQVKNSRRRFHGTSCSASCNFFVNLRGGPCCMSTCNVCNICTHGFKLHHSGKTAQTTGVGLRFGEGLYFSSVSGKANDYAKGAEKVDSRLRKVRCMFMASVAVGRAFVTKEASLPPEQCPPQGFDSVLGEVGEHLNYDEVVVYNEKAAIPTHLIAYYC